MVRIKICGITQLDDALAAVDEGAHAIGFVFDDSSYRCVSADTKLLESAAKIPWVSKVAVFGAVPESIPEVAHVCDSVQWAIGDRPSGFRTGIRSVCVEPTAVPLSLDDADALLLDAREPGKLGGTGKTIDWLAARAFASVQGRPTFLAGGLNPANVLAAIEAVGPYGVDVSSGVESAPGKKDHALIRRLCQQVYSAERIE